MSLVVNFLLTDKLFTMITILFCFLKAIRRSLLTEKVVYNSNIESYDFNNYLYRNWMHL